MTTDKSISGVAYVRREDYGDETAFLRAQVANGEVCPNCGKPERFGDPLGFPDHCNECEEYSEDDGVRCPACGEVFVVDCEDSCYFTEGEHEHTCAGCDHEFTVSTRVSVTYYSPPRIGGPLDVRLRGAPPEGEKR